MTWLESTLIIVLAVGIVYVSFLRSEISSQRQTMRAHGIYPSTPPYPLTPPAPPRQGHIPPEPMPAPAAAWPYNCHPAPPRPPTADEERAAAARRDDSAAAVGALEAATMAAREFGLALSVFSDILSPRVRLPDLRQPSYEEWRARHQQPQEKYS